MQAFDDRLIKSRTIKTHKRDASLKDTPQGEFIFDYNDGQKVHDEDMTIRNFIEVRNAYRTKVFPPTKKKTMIGGFVLAKALGDDDEDENDDDEELELKRKQDVVDLKPGQVADPTEGPYKKMIFLDNALAPMHRMKRLNKDFELPPYIAKFLKMQSIGLTLWDSFKRHPKFNNKERVVCMIHGSERFRLVSAIFKQNMYSGIYDDLDPLWTPINLFETDPKNLVKY